LDRLIHCDVTKVRGQAINLGTESHKSILEIAYLIVRKIGKPESVITYVSDRPGQVPRHTADSSKAARLLGWRPAVSFETGLDKTIAWYEANVGWWKKQMWLRDTPLETKPVRLAA
jgi:dTDP-glucose 4,6-dehydratase